jgi:hypothetical protein
VPLAPSPADPKTLYLGKSDDQDGYSAVLKSADGGGNWSVAWDWFTGLRAGVRALAIDPTRPATLYAGLDDVPMYSDKGGSQPGSGGVFKTTDGGISWKNAGLSVVRTGRFRERQAIMRALIAIYDRDHAFVLEISPFMTHWQESPTMPRQGVG